MAKQAAKHMASQPQQQTPRRRGRPTDWQWSEELMQDICDHLATGKSLMDIARLQGYPSDDSLYRQMARDPDFAERVARARSVGQHREVDLCVRMADMATPEDREVVKLRIWARQWRASKLNNKYGDRTQVTGPDGGAIQIEARRVQDISNLSEAERRYLKELLLATKADQAVIEGECEERGE